MANINCWDFLDCGKGPDGQLVADRVSDVCPCAVEGEFDGLNGGQFAGRYCWKVLGTPCHDSTQETLADKLTTCIRCAFYKHIRQEAGDGCDVSLLWDPALESGIPLIDGQHRRLVDNLEDILSATGDTQAVMSQCLHFLIKYTHEHFQTEERLMAKHRFPGLSEHAKAHAAFRESMAKAVKLIANTPDPEESTKLIKSMMVNWYVKHITGMDQKYSEYFHKQGLVHSMH